MLKRFELVLDFMWVSCCNVHIFSDMYIVIGTFSLWSLDLFFCFLFNTAAAFS